MRRGFTLIELLVALSILGVLTVMLFTSFYAINRSWETGRSVIDAVGHADYLMDQLAAGLRSAYYPGEGEEYGFILNDDGDENDSFEWSKVGPALVGEDAAFSDTPHRVRVSVTEPDGRFPGGFTVRAWRQGFQPDDFDPEEDTVELAISPKVVGLNCRVLDPDEERTVDDQLNWVDEWTKTNQIPTAIEITLFMEPPEAGDDPTETKRIVEIPMAPLSQNPSLGSSATKTSKSNTAVSVSGSGFRPSGQTITRPQGGGAPAGGGAAPPPP